MTRTSPAEVRGLFRRLVKAAGEAGIDTTGWALADEQHVGWNVENRENGALTGTLFLGRTAKDAALSLTSMTTALEMVPAREGVR